MDLAAVGTSEIWQLERIVAVWAVLFYPHGPINDADDGDHNIDNQTDYQIRHCDDDVQNEVRYVADDGSE